MSNLDKEISLVRAREKYFPQSLPNPEKALEESFWMYALAKEERGSMINIQIMSSCQLKCTFCRGSIGKDDLNNLKQKPIPIETFKLIVDKCTDGGVVYFELTPAIGEPFLDNGLFEKLDYLESNDKVDIFLVTTNLLKITDEQMEKLLRYKKLLFAISIYGFDEKSYSKNTGRDLFPVFMKNIKRLYSKLKDANGFHIEIAMRAGINYSDFPRDDLYYILRLISLFPGARIDNSEITNINRGGAIDHGSTFSERAKEDVTRSGVCPHGPGLGGGILPNGDLLFCPFNDIHRVGKMGNIFKQSLDEIYGGKKWQKLIEDHIKDNYIGICEDCNESWES